MVNATLAAAALYVGLPLGPGTAGPLRDDWLARLNAPAAIPRQHDWVPACHRCGADFYSPGSVRVSARAGIVQVAVEHRESGERSRRHVLTIDCRRRTVVEGRAYRFSRGRFIGVDTFEADADASPWSDFADDYERLIQKLCARRP